MAEDAGTSACLGCEQGYCIAERGATDAQDIAITLVDNVTGPNVGIGCRIDVKRVVEVLVPGAVTITMEGSVVFVVVPDVELS
jgi:hypothetical protein